MIKYLLSLITKKQNNKIKLLEKEIENLKDDIQKLKWKLKVM